MSRRTPMPQHLSCPNSTHSGAMAMSNYPPTRLPERHFQRPAEERRRRVGLHVSLKALQFRDCIIENAQTDICCNSEPLGSSPDLWRVQSGSRGLFCHMLRSISGAVVETSQVRHSVSFMFTPTSLLHTTTLRPQWPCDYASTP